MNMQSGFGFNLSSAPLVTNARSRSISAENPHGEKGKGGQAVNHLGVGRKGRPCINLPAGATITLAEIQGPGILQHFWLTVADKMPNSHAQEGNYLFRDLVLRMYWDDEEAPSVETPLGDFFCNGFGIRTNVNSLPISVNPTGGMNCYFAMPFHKSAKITIENQHIEEIEALFYTFNYTLVDELPLNTGYFHAHWRRTRSTEPGQDYTILDGIQGAGQYIGTYLAWASLERYWWGEGEIKFYLDGDKEWPTICGTGVEDYVGGAWCFTGETEPESYATPFLGYKYYNESAKLDRSYGQKVPMHGMYRWHLPDPIHFQSDLKVTIQVIGHDSKQLFERSDDVSSVAYWYQLEPHTAFPVLPSVSQRWPR